MEKLHQAGLYHIICISKNVVEYDRPMPKVAARQTDKANDKTASLFKIIWNKMFKYDFTSDLDENEVLKTQDIKEQIHINLDWMMIESWLDGDWILIGWWLKFYWVVIESWSDGD